MTTPNDPTESTPTPTPSPAALPAPTAVDAPAQSPTWPAPVAPPAMPVPTPVTAVRGPSRRRGVVDIVLVVAAIFAVGGIGFALGRITAPAATPTIGAGQFRANGQVPGGGEFGNGNGANRPNGGFGFGAGGGGLSISGTVTEITADHLTLKLASGQSVTIPLNATTTYHTQDAATATDVTSGATVQVQLTRGAGAGNGNGGNGNGNGNGGTGGLTIPAASNVTVIPK